MSRTATRLVIEAMVSYGYNLGIFMGHRYLFTLEITPLEVGKTYGDLPSHLTLMSRFFSDLIPDQLSENVRSIFERTEPIELTFGETVELGPKKLLVHTVEPLTDLRQLHSNLQTALDSSGVEYEYPQFIGDNHKPHVTKRTGIKFETGQHRTTAAAYLIEVVDGERVIRRKFELVAKNRMVEIIFESHSTTKDNKAKLTADTLQKS